jgi:hypothetical protein
MSMMDEFKPAKSMAQEVDEEHKAAVDAMMDTMAGVAQTKGWHVKKEQLNLAASLMLKKKEEEGERLPMPEIVSPDTKLMQEITKFVEARKENE